MRSYLQLTTTTGLISCDAGEHCLDSLRAGNERQRWEDIPLRRNALQSSSLRGVLTEIGFCGNSLVSSRVTRVGTVLSNVGRGTRLTMGTCGYCWYGPWILWHLRRCCWLRLAPCRLDSRRVGSLWLNVRMESSGSNLEEKMASSHWYTSTRSQGPQWHFGCRIQHSMDQRIRAKQKLHKKTRETCKVSGTREETKSHLHWQFLGIRQSLWRSVLASLHVHTTQIRNKWNCWRAGRRVKEGTSAVLFAVGSKWKLIGRFKEKLHLTSNCNRSPIWWEDAYERLFWATI